MNFNEYKMAQNKPARVVNTTEENIEQLSGIKTFTTSDIDTAQKSSQVKSSNALSVSLY